MLIILTDITTQNSITDWISAIGTILGLPLIIVAVYRLFKKDIDKERKIVSLEKLAVSQDEMIKKMTEQIQELSNQTAEFQYQSECMRESNNILNKQVELQNNAFMYSKELEEKKFEIQRMKRLNDIKPHFINNGVSTSSSNVTIMLKNKGNTARNIVLKKVQGDFLHFGKLDSDKEIDSGKNIEIKGNVTSAGRNLDNATRNYTLELFFEDIESNNYKQVITNQKVSKPELLEEDKS